MKDFVTCILIFSINSMATFVKVTKDFVNVIKEPCLPVITTYVKTFVMFTKNPVVTGHLAGRPS